MAEPVTPGSFAGVLPKAGVPRRSNRADGGPDEECCGPPECPRELPRSFVAGSVAGGSDAVNLVRPIRRGDAFKVAVPKDCLLQFWNAANDTVISGFAHEAGTHRYVCPWADLGTVTALFAPTGTSAGITVLVWLEGEEL